jgi:2-oxoglutarate ferredoxin oxidoreductase subunit beta
VAKTVDWNPVHLHSTLQSGVQAQGLSFVHILQRCPQYTSKVYEELQQDPSRVLLLTHENGIEVDPAIERLFPNTVEHDPGNITEALDIAHREDVLPIGLFFQDPTRPVYEDISVQGVDMTVEERLKNMNTELDRFAI